MSAVDSLRWKTRVLKIMQARRPGLPLTHVEVEEILEKHLLGWTPGRVCKMLLDREQSRSTHAQAPERMVK